MNSYRCIVCDCNITSAQVYERHVQGARHRQLLKAEPIGKDPSLRRVNPDHQVLCVVCNESVHVNDLKEHKKGEPHRKKIDLKQCKSTPAPSPARKSITLENTNASFRKRKTRENVLLAPSRRIVLVPYQVKALAIALDEAGGKNPQRSGALHSRKKQACIRPKVGKNSISTPVLTVSADIDEGSAPLDESDNAGSVLNDETTDSHDDAQGNINHEFDDDDSEDERESESEAEDQDEDQKDNDERAFDEIIRKRSPHIFRLVELAPDLQRLIVQGRRRLIAERDGLNSSNSLSELELSSFEILCDLVTGLREELIDMSEKEAVDVAKRMNDAASSARVTDVRKAKSNIIKILAYLDDSFKSEEEELAVKSNRGFKSDKLGEMLCPVDLDWKDDKVRGRIRSGKVEVSADQFPRGIYENCECDPNDYEQGLLKNETLVHFAKLLLTGLSSAFNRTAGPIRRGTIAEISGMKEMSPRVIAYCVCLMRHSISDKEVWSLMDGTFDTTVLYWNIVGIFDGSKSSNRLLRWWNVQIFGSQRTRPEKRPLTTLELLKAQRAAKRART